MGSVSVLQSGLQVSTIHTQEAAVALAEHSEEADTRTILGDGLA